MARYSRARRLYSLNNSLDISFNYILQNDMIFGIVNLIPVKLHRLYQFATQNERKCEQNGRFESKTLLPVR